MKLVILAGGEGKRLYPLTKDIPKPMVQLAGKPVLQHTIELAHIQSIDDIIICSGYKHEVIEDYFGDGSKFGVNISYSVEDKPMGTGGALRLMSRYVPNKNDDLIVLNGDVVCKMDLRELFWYHFYMNVEATVVVHDSDHPEDSDLVEFDESTGKVKKFWLRPHKEIPSVNKSLAGVYVLKARTLYGYIPDGYSLEKELIPKLHDSNYEVYCYDTKEYIKDMGTFERLKKIEEELSKP